MMPSANCAACFLFNSCELGLVRVIPFYSFMAWRSAAMTASGSTGALMTQAHWLASDTHGFWAPSTADAVESWCSYMCRTSRHHTLHAAHTLRI